MQHLGQNRFSIEVSTTSSTEAVTLMPPASASVVHLHEFVGTLSAAGTMRVQSATTSSTGVTDLTGPLTAVAGNLRLDIPLRLDLAACLQSTAGGRLQLRSTGVNINGYAICSRLPTS